MGLDFTALETALKNAHTQRAIQDFTGVLNYEAGNLALKPEKPATEPPTAPHRDATHSHKLDAEKRERAQLREMYHAYQENIKKAGSCRSDILKGIKQGEDPLALLLTAVECISLMTGDTVIYKQAKEDITAIYGWGLGNIPPLRIQLQEATERLHKLENAEVIPEEAQRVNNAIRAHRELISTLQGRIQRANSTVNPKTIQDIIEGEVDRLRELQTDRQAT